MADHPATQLPELPAGAIDTLLERAGALVYAVDAEERVVTANLALLGRTELDPASLTDLRSLLRVLYPDASLRESVYAAHRVAIQGDSARGAEWPLTTALGEVRAVRWSLVCPRPDLLVALGEDLTERRSLERWVRLQGAVLDVLPAAVLVVGTDGRVAYWSTGAARLFGVPDSEMLERPLDRIFPEGAGNVVASWLAAAMGGRGKLTRELIRADGERFEAGVELGRVDDEKGRLTGMTVVVHPARLEAAAPEASAEAAPGLDAALGNLGAVAVALTGLDGVVRVWSAGAERLAGTPGARAKGQRLLDEVLRVPALGWENLSSRLATRPRHTARVVVERPNGTRVAVDLDAVLVRSRGTPEGVLVVAVDRSEAEALAAESAAAKAGALSAAVGVTMSRHLADHASAVGPEEATLAARLHLLAGIAELVGSGADAAALEQFATRARVAEAAAESTRALDHLLEASARLRTLVQDLAALQAPEPSPPAPVHLGRELAAARALVGTPAGALAELSTALDALPLARASRGPLLRALCLLLLAGAESCRAVEDGRVSVEGRHAGGWVVLELRDNGAGYPVEVQSRLGEPTWLAAQPGLAPYLLGLAKDAVRLAGGNLELTSAQGTGTRARLSFPASDASVAVLPLDAPRAGPGAHGRVLLVEDDDLLRRSLGRFLGEQHQVTTAPSLSDALALVESGAFDAVVAGLTPPERLGARLLDALVEAAPHLRRRTVVLVDPTLRPATRDLLLDGAHILLTRPLDVAALRSILLHLVPPEEIQLDG